MPTLLVRNIHALATMDDSRRELRHAAIYVRDREIVAVGADADMPASARDADRIIDASKHVVVPGLVNTHHHLFQSLTRAMAQECGLFEWLAALYPLWARLTGEAAYVSAKLGMAELMLSGCTTTSDHLYLYPNDVRLDDTVRAGCDMGMRFHASRGSMSVGTSAGGLPPDSLVERDDAILADTRRVIEAYHDARRFSMTRIAVAPCSPFSVSPELMRESAALARSYDVGLHTHLAENDRDVAYSLEKFGCRPGAYAQSLGWTGARRVARALRQARRRRDRLVRAHADRGVPLPRIQPAARIGTRAAGANARVGHARRTWRRRLGVQRRRPPARRGAPGDALARSGGDAAALSARSALELATRGGASVLGRDDIGALAPGMAADFAGFRIDTPAFAGALHDPIAALLLCAPAHADFTVIDGAVRVADGRLVDVDLPALLDAHRDHAQRLRVA